MNICLNYYGELRNLELTKYTYLNYIKSDNAKYHIIYTTWEDTNIDKFIEFFPDAYINKIAYPDIHHYKDLLNNYTMDITNPNKTLSHYILGMYVKQSTRYTIDNYIEQNNVTFDLVITLRTYLYFNRSFVSYYGLVLPTLSNNNVYVPEKPKFDVYKTSHNQDALPDGLTISNTHVAKIVVSQLDILNNCVVNNTNYFHPESSFYNMLFYNQLEIKILPNLFSFPQPVF